jgi:FAD/FMN-containing dehydrogenase
VVNAAERQERARIGAGKRWSQPGARERQAEAARAAMYRRLRDQVDPDGVMDPDELSAAISSAASEQAARLRLAKLRKDNR